MRNRLASVPIALQNRSARYLLRFLFYYHCLWSCLILLSSFIIFSPANLNTDKLSLGISCKSSGQFSCLMIQIRLCSIVKAIIFPSVAESSMKSFLKSSSGPKYINHPFFPYAFIEARLLTICLSSSFRHLWC